MCNQRGCINVIQCSFVHFTWERSLSIVNQTVHFFKGYCTSKYRIGNGVSVFNSQSMLCARIVYVMLLTHCLSVRLRSGSHAWVLSLKAVFGSTGWCDIIYHLPTGSWARGERWWRGRCTSRRPTTTRHLHFASTTQPSDQSHWLLVGGTDPIGLSAAGEVPS